LKSWRKNVGYVSQDIFLLNDTIANNINFYNKKISQSEIEEAAKKANIYDFIQSLPDKFNSEIGEKGVFLSMGQRQRIVIARTLVRKPKILILDEATSALDSESEIKIQKVIENLKGEITVIAIAHRLSTVVNSDKILVLEDGLIKEQGKPEVLLKDKESYFYKVYNIRGK
jgi:ABC-type multidrug transport system fused ATPase/permease subunit